MPRQCPHCDYDMTGLPSDRCPECGQIYDPVLAMRQRLARSGQGLKAADALLVLATVVVGNATEWHTLGWVALASLGWVWLRREGIKRRPLALWLMLPVLIGAGAYSDAMRADPRVAPVLIGVAVMIAVLETLRFGWRAPGAVMQAVGIAFAVTWCIGAVFAAVSLVIGGSSGGIRFMMVEIPTDTRVRCALVLLVEIVLIAIGIAVWRAGVWVSGLSRAGGSGVASGG